MEYKKRILENAYLVVEDTKSKKIHSMNVTDEHVHDDSKVLPRLVEDIIKSGSMTAAAVAIGKIFTDGASMITMTFLEVCGRQWNLALYQRMLKFD